MAEGTLEIFKKGMPLFSMLQDENRQQILVMLCKVDHMTVNQITDKLALSRPAVSHHLKLLLDAGLVEVSQNGTERYYSVQMEPAMKVLKDLTASLEKDLQSRASQ